MLNAEQIADLKRTMRSHRICVIVPTYNNAGTLSSVVDDILRYSEDVIVVNDGSTDGTQEIIDSYGDRIDQVSYPDNGGKGTALKRGFRRAIERGFNYAITIDSDGQHYAKNIPDFVRAIVEHPDTLIVGARNLSNVDINGKSSFANKFSNFWFAIQTGRALPDTQTGYRAYPLRHLHGLNLLTARYEAELELMVYAAWNGVEILSIPIDVYYPPQAERVSHFRPALDFTRISILNTALCFGAILYGAPVRFYHALRKRKFFNKEVKFFTHTKGKRKDAAFTLGRLLRTSYGMGFFGIWSICVFIPYVKIHFKYGKNTPEKRLKFHKLLKWISAFLIRRFPGATARFFNPHNERFDKPAIIVANHQSNLDLPVIMSRHEKMVFLTNDWVWNNFFIGDIVRNAEFFPVSQGVDSIMQNLEDLRNRGYSIVVFPEGTRSKDCSIKRFHQGAFLLGRQLKMDIVPAVLHGLGHYYPKGEYVCRKGVLTLSILPRIPYEEDKQITCLEEASAVRKRITEEYKRIEKKYEKSLYFKHLILCKYAWRGWNTVSKVKKFIRNIDKYTPYIDFESGDVRRVRVINSGIGIFPLLYALVNKDVEVYAFEENIANFNVASSTSGLPKNLKFIHAVTHSDYQPEGIVFDKTFLLSSESDKESPIDYEMFSPKTIELK